MEHTEAKTVSFVTFAICVTVCFFLFTVKSCLVERDKVELEMRKYPVKIEREHTQRTTVDTRPNEQ